MESNNWDLLIDDGNAEVDDDDDDDHGDYDDDEI